MRIIVIACSIDQLFYSNLPLLYKFLFCAFTLICTCTGSPNTYNRLILYGFHIVSYSLSIASNVAGEKKHVFLHREIAMNFVWLELNPFGHQNLTSINSIISIISNDTAARFSSIRKQGPRKYLIEFS